MSSSRCERWTRTIADTTKVSYDWYGGDFRMSAAGAEPREIARQVLGSRLDLAHDRMWVVTCLRAPLLGVGQLVERPKPDTQALQFLCLLLSEDTSSPL